MFKICSDSFSPNFVWLIIRNITNTYFVFLFVFSSFSIRFQEIEFMPNNKCLQLAICFIVKIHDDKQMSTYPLPVLSFRPAASACGTDSSTSTSSASVFRIFFLILLLRPWSGSPEDSATSANKHNDFLMLDHLVDSSRSRWLTTPWGAGCGWLDGWAATERWRWGCVTNLGSATLTPWLFWSAGQIVCTQPVASQCVT